MADIEDLLFREGAKISPKQLAMLRREKEAIEASERQALERVSEWTLTCAKRGSPGFVGRSGEIFQDPEEVKRWEREAEKWARGNWWSRELGERWKKERGEKGTSGSLTGLANGGILIGVKGGKRKGKEIRLERKLLEEKGMGNWLKYPMRDDEDGEEGRSSEESPVVGLENTAANTNEAEAFPKRVFGRLKKRFTV